jgi:hypothetical protein
VTAQEVEGDHKGPDYSSDRPEERTCVLYILCGKLRGVYANSPIAQHVYPSGLQWAPLGPFYSVWEVKGDVCKFTHCTACLPQWFAMGTLSVGGRRTLCRGMTHYLSG